MDVHSRLYIVCVGHVKIANMNKIIQHDKIMIIQHDQSAAAASSHMIYNIYDAHIIV